MIDGPFADEAERAGWLSGFTVSDGFEAKLKAMRAHAPQITEDGPFFAGAKIIGDQMWGREYYRFAAGVPFPAADGWADDLFAGLD